MRPRTLNVPAEANLKDAEAAEELATSPASVKSPSLLKSYEYLNPAATSAGDGSVRLENETLLGVPSATAAPAAKVARGATLAIRTVVVRTLAAVVRAAIVRVVAPSMLAAEKRGLAPVASTSKVVPL